MSGESYQWLSSNVLTGFTNDRPAWWLSYAKHEGFTPRTYPGAVDMTDVDDLLTSWSPTTESLYTADMSEVRTHKLVKASDNGEHMAVIGIDHAIHSYADWLNGTVKETVSPGELEVSSAGMLRERCQAWIQIERPDSAVGPDGIKFSPYVTLSTSLDGSLASQINQNTTMVVCDNTLAITRNQGVAFKHTSRSGSKLGAFRGVMLAIMRGESDFRAELERQLAVKVDDSQFSRFIESFVPIAEDDRPAKKTRAERKRQEITQLYRSDPRVAEWRGTEFGVVQAANTWQTHLSQLRNGTAYEMSDTNLRAMRNYSERMRPVKAGTDSADQTTAKILESVL